MREDERGVVKRLDLNEICWNGQNWHYWIK
jgi:hypothetical protein